jgi:hypothetical protein
MAFSTLFWLAATSSYAQSVQTGYLGKFDFLGAQTWSWSEGAPANDPQVQKLIRSEVERGLQKRGWKRVEQGGDFWIRAEVVSTVSSMVGALRIDAVDPSTELPVWRGLAAGVRSSTEKRNLKQVKAAIREMFATFPKNVEP